MFIWDFAVELVLGQIIDWVYAQIVEFLSEFFVKMGNMGVELFEMGWVQAIVMFFSLFGWSLYVVGLAVSACEFGIEYQGGRASLKDTALNAIKGFFAASLFTILPVELYKTSLSLQGMLASAITNISETTTIGERALEMLNAPPLPAENTIFPLFIIIAMGYCVIKIFFSNLKRGGILLIQIAVGSMYMLSIPRGYIDGFTSWCKQIIGICLTAFLQTTILVAGLMVFNDHALLGLGLMLSAGEIPRICGAFGLDTNTRTNIAGAVHATQQAINISKTIAAAIK